MKEDSPSISCGSCLRELCQLEKTHAVYLTTMWSHRASQFIYILSSPNTCYVRSPQTLVHAPEAFGKTLSSWAQYVHVCHLYCFTSSIHVSTVYPNPKKWFTLKKWLWRALKRWAGCTDSLQKSNLSILHENADCVQTTLRELCQSHTLLWQPERCCTKR